MSDIEKKEQETEIEKVEEEQIRKRVLTPEICSWVDDEGEGYEIEIYLPGVEKDTIELKMRDDRFFIKGETDTITYYGQYLICCPIDAEQAKSVYKNGLLKIHVPFKDLIDESINIKIN